MTQSINRFKFLSASILAISLTACSTAPQNGVVATDLSGSLSQMWSSVFTGELRPAPQPSYRFGGQPSLRGQYAFGAPDAAFKTPRLKHIISQRAAYQPHNLGSAPQYHSRQPLGAQQAFSQHFVPQAIIQQPTIPAPQPMVMSTPVQAPIHSGAQRPAQYPMQMQSPPQSAAHDFTQYRPQAIDRPFKESPFQAETSVIQPEQSRKRSFGSRVLSIFNGSNDQGFSEKMGGYEDMQTQQSRADYEPQAMQRQDIQQPQTLAARPAQSQPVMADPALKRDAYPMQAAAPMPATIPMASIPPRASIDDNLAKTGRDTAPMSQDWQAANQDIGDSLSYVKIGGGSKISEWQDCEKQAGGYFIATPTGFIVDPKFDVCMRGFGYKPEAEAEAILSVQAPISRTQSETEIQIAQSREIDTTAIPTSRRYPSRERRGG